MKVEDVKKGMSIRYAGLFNYEDLTKGKIYTVKRVDHPGQGWVKMITDNGIENGFNAKAFEPVEVAHSSRPTSSKTRIETSIAMI